jgi:hypothetical protein
MHGAERLTEGKPEQGPSGSVQREAPANPSGQVHGGWDDKRSAGQHQKSRRKAEQRGESVQRREGRKER